jgi:para-nitrobenzyl esterase
MTLDRRAVLAGAAALSAATRVNATGVAGPVATTVAGRVRGALVGGINVFKGVRYGADTAPRRFQPAESPRPPGRASPDVLRL